MSARLAFGPGDPPPAAPDALLAAHLRAYLGAWPPEHDVDVFGWPGRLEPAWDGAYALAVVVTSPDGTVISVPPEDAETVRQLDGRVRSESFRADLANAVGSPGRFSPWLVLRWSTAPAALPPIGDWVDADDPGLPDWLHAFTSPVLAALDGTGRYLGGVGIKPHTQCGRELAVGTAEEARGRGIGRRLVAHAARQVLADGAVPLYVHHADNAASARVADAAGFPDLGWRLLVVFGP